MALNQAFLALIVTLQQTLISQILFTCHCYSFLPLYFSLSCVEELLFLFYNLLKPYIQIVFVCSRDPSAFIWFVMDWLICRIIYGTPSNYLQIHNSKASIFFLSLLSVQLSLSAARNLLLLSIQSFVALKYLYSSYSYLVIVSS